jgi:hypothetical protein
MDDRAKELLALIREFGGVTKVSRYLEMTPYGLYDFIRRGDLKPKDAALMEKLSNGAIKADQLNRVVDWEIIRSTARKELVKKIQDGGKFHD